MRPRVVGAVGLSIGVELAHNLRLEVLGRFSHTSGMIVDYGWMRGRSSSVGTGCGDHWDKELPQRAGLAGQLRRRQRRTNDPSLARALAEVGAMAGSDDRTAPQKSKKRRTDCPSEIRTSFFSYHLIR